MPTLLGLRLFQWAGFFHDDADVDGLEFQDPYPNPEETLLAMEAAVCRGFWSFGTPRKKIRTIGRTRKAKGVKLPNHRNRPAVHAARAGRLLSKENKC